MSRNAAIGLIVAWCAAIGIVYSLQSGSASVSQVHNAEQAPIAVDASSISSVRDAESILPEPALPAPKALEEVHSDSPISVSATVSIKGRVVSDLGSPIPAARIVLFPPLFRLRELGVPVDDVVLGRETLASAETSRDGLFTLELLPPAVDAMRSGPGGDWPVVLIEAEGYATGAIELLGSAIGVRDCGDVRLVSGRTIVGRVVDSFNGPVEGARIAAGVPKFVSDDGLTPGSGWRFTDSRVYTSERSDSEGRFAIDGLSLGHNTELSVTAGGFLPSTVKVDESEVSDAEVIVRLQEGHQLCVDVVDASGSEVPGAKVWGVIRSKLEVPSPDDTIWTDLALAEVSGVAARPSSACDYLLSGLSEGLLDVLVCAPGFHPAKVRSNASTVGGVINVVLERELSRRLRVISASTGERVAHAVVDARVDSSSAIVEAQSLEVTEDPGGDFVVHGGEPSAVIVTVTAPGYGVWSGRVTGWTADPMDSEVIRMELASAIEVRVENTEGLPLAEARVSAMPSAYGLTAAGRRLMAREESTSNNGTCLLAGLSSGQWVVSVSLDGYVATSKVFDVASERRITQWSCVLRHSATIRGVLSNTRGDRLVGESLTAVLRKSSSDSQQELVQRSFETQTSTDGAFRFAGLADGEWRIGGQFGVLVSVAASDDKVISVVWPTPSRLVGHVIAPNGSGVSALVIVADSGGNPAQVAHAGDDGVFSVIMGHAGEYGVHAISLSTPGMTDVVRVECVENRIAEVNLVVGPARVSGVCVDRISKAVVDGVRVSVIRDGMYRLGISSWSSDGAKVVAWPLTDLRGKFELRLPPGRYRLIASKAGYVAVERDIEVLRADDDLSFVVEL